jgi:cytochrome oxidase Cu insertion factor (SCO1/SenC/PrrC family)
MKTRRVRSASVFLFIAVAWISADDASGQRRPSKGRANRTPDRIKEGDVAPTFELKSVDGKQSFKLEDYRGKKPVALVFGSYT